MKKLMLLVISICGLSQNSYANEIPENVEFVCKPSQIFDEQFLEYLSEEKEAGDISFIKTGNAWTVKAGKKTYTTDKKSSKKIFIEYINDGGTPRLYFYQKFQGGDQQTFSMHFSDGLPTEKQKTYWLSITGEDPIADYQCVLF